MMLATITIPAPLAREGDRVRVLNYRTVEGKWERGTLASEPTWYVSRHCAHDGRWHYRVKLERESAAGRPIHLNVGMEQIEIEVEVARRG